MAYVYCPSLMMFVLSVSHMTGRGNFNKKYNIFTAVALKNTGYHDKYLVLACDYSQKLWWKDPYKKFNTSNVAWAALQTVL